MVKTIGIGKRISNAFNALRTKKESGNVYHYLGWMNANTNSKFVKDILTRKERKTHEEKRDCKMAYRDNSLVYSSIRTYKDLIRGDKPYVETNNLALKKYVEDKFTVRTGFSAAEDVAIEEALVTGDGYIEEVKEHGVIEYRPIYNSEDIYIDYDYEKDEVIRYIMRVYSQNLGKNGVKQFTLKTPYGIESVNGWEIPKESMIHYKFGNDVWGVYGRSAIAATLNDIEILNRIERSIGVIAMYKAIPKKMLMPDSNDEEDRFSQPEIEQIEQLLRDSSDFENPILDRRVTTLDLSDGGKDINMSDYIDYLKRKITVAMAPEFLIHGEEVNRATSREQKQTYYLRVASTRHPFEMTSTKALREGVNYTLKDNKLRKDLIGTFTYHFGEFDIKLPEEKFAEVMKQWNDGVITLAEARKAFEHPEVEGTDVFKWEVTSTEPDLLPAENEKNGKPTKTETKETKGVKSKR